MMSLGEKKNTSKKSLLKQKTNSQPIFTSSINSQYLRQQVHFDSLETDLDFEGSSNLLLGEINWDTVMTIDQPKDNFESAKPST